MLRAVRAAAGAVMILRALWSAAGQSTQERLLQGKAWPFTRKPGLAPGFESYLSTDSPRASPSSSVKWREASQPCVSRWGIVRVQCRNTGEAPSKLQGVGRVSQEISGGWSG